MFWELVLIYGLMAALIGGMFFALWMLPWSDKEAQAVHESFVKSIRPKPLPIRNRTSQQNYFS